MILGIVVASVFLFLAFMLVVGVVAFFLTRKKPLPAQQQPALEAWERDQIVNVVEQHILDERREASKQVAAKALQAATVPK